MTLVKFDAKLYPHIDLSVAVQMSRKTKLLPLCELKLEGNCQGILLVPVDKDDETKGFNWASTPKIKGCKENCKFHRRTCERC